MKDKHKLPVSEQYTVKFKIGNYFDKVMCDMMPIDCCHILLGRPWQYDRHVVHDGRLNQYILWVNGRKKTLFPLIEVSNELNFTTIGVCMINGKKFKEDMKRNQFCLTMIPRKPSFDNNG